MSTLAKEEKVMLRIQALSLLSSSTKQVELCGDLLVKEHCANRCHL